ncbi:MAG: DUF2202 domain-containing protein [Thiolinea sp.]
MKLRHTFRNVLLTSLIVLLTACNDSNNTTAMNGAGNGAGNGNSSGGDNHQDTELVFEVDDFQPLTAAETTTLLFVREEEKMARDVYLKLYDQWQKKTFQNIATKSEQQHMDAVKVLLDGYGLNDPVISNDIGEFTDTDIKTLYRQLLVDGEDSLEDALQVGAYIEEFDLIDLVDARLEAMNGSNPEPIIVTYSRLLCGSRNHLRAFVKQIEADGVTYQAQLLSQDEVDLIVDSEQEDCGSITE